MPGLLALLPSNAKTLPEAEYSKTFFGAENATVAADERYKSAEFPAVGIIKNKLAPCPISTLPEHLKSGTPLFAEAVTYKRAPLFSVSDEAMCAPDPDE